MMNNYNPLSLGVYSYLKKWNSGSIGSPPTTNSIKKSASLQWFAAILFLLMGMSNYGQTVLIDPAGDGGFSNGTTFAANGWTLANYAPSVNKWVAGTAVTAAPFSGRSAYISTNGGTSNTYDNSASTTAYFYRDVAVPAGTVYLPLSFTWRSNGESSWDMIQVYVAPTTVTPVPDLHPGSGTAGPIPTSLTGATQLGFFQVQTTPQTGNVLIPASWAGQTVRLIFMWKSDTSVGTDPPAAIDNIGLTAYSTLPAYTATANGGLWSSPATWIGGAVPTPGVNVTVPAGSIVTVDQVTTYNDLTIGGTVQWNGSSNAMTLAGNLTINAGGAFYPHTTGGTGQALTIGGNLTNNGYANLAHGTGSLTFNGAGSTLGGSGTFQGDGTRGIIRALLFANTGSNAITTTQNLVATAASAVTAGSLNTNGKLTLDNTAQVYGQAFNTRVSNIAVTNMGTTAYSVAPVVFGAGVTQWDAITGVANTLYVSGANVYRCTAAASIGATAPTHTAGIVDNLLWIGTTGTLGNPFQFSTSVSTGTQVFYGNNLYVCTVAGIASSAAPPVHTSGTAASGAATFLYVGSPASASVNFDSVTGTVRSLNLTSAGTGLSGNPSVSFSVGVLAGTGAGAAATAVVNQSIGGATTMLMQKSGVATISGGLTINSDQGTVIATSNPQASSGIGAVFATNGGVAYTSAPTVGFGGPTALNLVVDPGSGYTAVPTVTVTGGTLVSGTALTTSNFTIAVNNGTVQAVYLSGGDATYSVPPTIALSAGNAVIAWPSGCWPAATATIGSNGQVTNFTVTSSGYGYVAAPNVGVTGGTPVTAASGVSGRVGLYNLTLNFFLPAATAVVSPDDVVIPDTRKLNNLTLAGNGNGLNLTNGDLTLYGSSPLSLTASASVPGNILNLGGSNLNFTWNGYAGTGSTFGATNTYITNGSMSVTGRGGASTFTFPFSGRVIWFAGSTPTTATTGSSVTRVTVSDTAAPTNATVGTGIALGNRAFRVQLGQIGTGGFASSPVTGTNPTIDLGFNSQDGLTVTQNNLFVADGTNLAGPWTIRSTAFGASGALPATGTKVTATAAPGPIVPTSNSVYAWATSAPSITSFTPLTICAASGSFTITGTNFSGVTAVTIGGTAVTSFTIVSDTQITGFAGVGTTGVAAVTKNGITVVGTETITVNPAPVAPSVLPTSATVNVGTMVNLTASGSETTFNWYSTATGGSPIFTGAAYNAAYCATTTVYVAQSNGSCDGPRTAVTITVNPIVISASTATFCGTGGTTTLSTPSLAGATYAWTSLTPSATIVSGGSTNSADVTVTETSDFQLVVTGPNGCNTTLFYSVGVYALPSATVTTSASGVCPGTSATINSGLVAGNFISNAIPHAPHTPPVGATTLVNAGVMGVTPNISYGFDGDLDDAGWGARPIGFNFNFFGTTYTTINIGTNGTVFFGAPLDASATDFTFTTLPSTVEPFNMVAVLAMDNNLAGATGGAIRHWTEGVAPNRRFIVQYDNVQEFGDATKFSTSQAIFYETTGIIEVHVTSSTNVDRQKLVGVNNGNGTVGVLAYASGTVTSTNPQNPISNPFAYRFTPPYNYTTTWTADEGEGPFVIASGTNIFSQEVAPTVTTTYTISYTNQTTGCTNALNSAQVEMVILGNTAPTGVNALASSTVLCPGFSTNLSTDYTGSPDGLTYQWQQNTGSTWDDILGATDPTYTATPTVATSYRVRIRSCDNVAGQSFSAPVAVTITDVTITSSTGASRCGTGPVSISASGTGTQIGWYANETGGTALFTGSPWNIASIGTTTTYWVASEVSAPNFCSGVRVPVTVTVTPAPVLTLSSSSATLCSGQASPLITVTSNPADYNSYVWTPSTGVTGDQNVGWTITPAASGTYTLNTSEPGGCVNSATYTFTVNPNAAAPTVTPSSASVGCNATVPVLLSVGTSYVNPTPPVVTCLNVTNGQWPSGTQNPVCDGTTVHNIGTSFTAEYSLVNVAPNTLYTFSSSVAGDVTVITQTDGTTVLAAGGPSESVVWYNDAGLTQIRFWTERDDCSVINTSRVRRIVCSGNPTAVFSPTTGLWLDAAMTQPYLGTSVSGVYALPGTTTTYQAVANNSFNCPSVPTEVTVTVEPCETILNLKLFVEGYYLGGSTMASVKTNQDFGVSPADEVEDITVELHNADAPYEMLHTTVATLKTDGTAIASFTTAPSGSFYVAVKGVNMVQTWSADPVLVGAPATYDFSTSAAQAYGANQLDMGGVFVIYSGDINQDEAIDNSDGVDLTNDIINSEFGIKVTDLNGDGAVDNSDAPYFENNATNSIFSNHP